MYLTKRIGLAVGAAALTVTGGSFADTISGASNDDLKVLLNNALVRIDQLEAKQSDAWLTEQRADEIRGLVQDVLADADTRASLLAQGITAGYDDGAIIASSDGNWSLHTNIHMQQRFIYNNQGNPAGGTVDEHRYGFENTRTKFILSGNVVNPHWIYKIEINVGSPGAAIEHGDTRAGTGDAYIGYKFGHDWTIFFGTMKEHVLREDMVDSRYQLAVERSALNYFFTSGRADGIAFDYHGDNFIIAGGISDGAASGQTTALTADNDYSFVGRIQWLHSGHWHQFDDFTNRPGGESGLMFGAAFHHQTSEDGPGLVDTDTTLLTVDVSAEFEGANLFAAYIYRNVDTSGGSEFDQNGFIIQGGINLGDEWEAFARYEWADFDSMGGATEEDLSLITFGVNKYFAGHNAKWTTDVGIGTDTINFIHGHSGEIAGLRPDSGTEDGQLVIRSQIQIVF